MPARSLTRDWKRSLDSRFRPCGQPNTQIVLCVAAMIASVGLPPFSCRGRPDMSAATAPFEPLPAAVRTRFIRSDLDTLFISPKNGIGQARDVLRPSAWSCLDRASHVPNLLCALLDTTKIAQLVLCGSESEPCQDVYWTEIEHLLKRLSRPRTPSYSQSIRRLLACRSHACRSFSGSSSITGHTPKTAAWSVSLSGGQPPPIRRPQPSEGRERSSDVSSTHCP